MLILEVTTMRSQFRVAAMVVALLAALTGGLRASGQQPTVQQPTLPQPPPSGGAAPGQSLGIASVVNLRDVGGYTTVDGLVVRQKALYRSNQLARVAPGDRPKMDALGLKFVYDLRRENEHTGAPDVLPSGATCVWLNVMADSPRTTRTAPGEVDEVARESSAGDQGPDPYLETYRKFVSLPSAQKAYSQLFTELQQEEHLPALFHCAAGKDRAGWATAALLSLLGVPREVVFEDYLLSNKYLSARLRVKSEHLQSAFDEVDAKYGSIENYFAKALNIDAAGQQKLKDRFLVGAKD